MAGIFIFYADSFRSEETVKVELPEIESAIGVKEDPQARIRFERMQVIDPSTGSLPDDIRNQEIAFSKRHITRDQFELLRNSGAAETEWTFAGPFNVGGRTRAAALDLLDQSGNTLLAGGVSGGMWKTVNGGSTWARKSDPELRNSITAIAQDIRPGRETT